MTLPVSVFGFNGSEVRTFGTWDAPLFVAKDICDILGISQYRAALMRLEDYEKGRSVKVDTLGGAQSVATITEAGLYSLINRSNKPIAKAFKKWVNTEVLPSIRKTGSYSVPRVRDDLRLSSTEVRKETMAALQQSGFTQQHHFINVTQMVYRGLFDMDAAQLRKARGLDEKANVRDHLTKEELGMVRTLELLVQQVLISKVFTSSADLNKYVRTISQNMKTVGGVDPKLFVDGNK